MVEWELVCKVGELGGNRAQGSGYFLVIPYFWESIYSSETKNSLKLEEIKVTNYEDRFSKKELDKLVRKAEKYKADDEEMKKKIEARNSVESYFVNLKNIINDEKLSSKHGVANKEKMKEAIEVANLWQNKNRFIKLENLEEIVMELQGLGIR
ncbi:hypothetical protein POM88_024813 [Heracleum sosnowskyi]|uniref:Uncharacterized protein n=1 Tax=Heracleum sosnowskyi TaxID=360622 RepID=A0AAD8I2R8_9APIA|nr:hypothetical protein POM88_024813 [Heracleum sosnowskyi]